MVTDKEDIKVLMILQHLSFGMDGSIFGIERGTRIFEPDLSTLIKKMVTRGLVTRNDFMDDEDDEERRIGIQTRVVNTQKGFAVLEKAGL